MSESKIKLLVVDDEVRFLTTLTQRLSMRDFAVTPVTSGQEALERAEEQEFDLALVDLKMPGMNGEQTLEMLKKEHQWMEVVILTGHGSIDSAVECTKSGAYSYLQKPCEWDQLLSVLTEAYKKKVMNKLNIREQKMNELLEMSTYSSPRALLERIRKMDQED